MAKKKHCYACRALDYDTSRSKCTLGYPIKMKYSVATGLSTPAPVDLNCPKPRTYDELFRLLEEKKAKEVGSG